MPRRGSCCSACSNAKLLLLLLLLQSIPRRNCGCPPPVPAKPQSPLQRLTSLNLMLGFSCQVTWTLRTTPARFRTASPRRPVAPGKNSTCFCDLIPGSARLLDVGPSRAIRRHNPALHMLLALSASPTRVVASVTVHRRRARPAPNLRRRLLARRRHLSARRSSPCLVSLSTAPSLLSASMCGTTRGLKSTAIGRSHCSNVHVAGTVLARRISSMLHWRQHVRTAAVWSFFAQECTLSTAPCSCLMACNCRASLLNWYPSTSERCLALSKA